MDVGAAVRARASAVREEAADASRERSISPSEERSAGAIVDEALVRGGLTTRRHDFGEEGRKAGTLAVLTEAKEVLTSDDLDEPTRLFAIAHELGHHHLHGDEHLKDGYGLSLRYEDGCVFVDGYSHRSLKEVQADLFAWEFLCPSAALLRRLTAGDTPEQVARRLGLPGDLVRGQAINALLRTSKDEIRPWSDVRPRSLSPEQEACTAGSPEPVLVLGGPGTGKTTVLVDAVRMAMVAKERASGMLFVAATKASAERHHAALSADWPKLAGHAFFGTFEDLAHEIVVRWPTSVERTEAFSILDRVAALDAYRSAVSMGRLAAAKGDSLRALDSARLRRRDQVPDDITIRAEVFDDLLADEDRVDGGGLVTLAIEVLQADAGARESLRRRFTHIFVDDLQDAAPAAVTLLRLLRDHARVVAAADPTQSLDGFRGRSGASVPAFTSEFSPQVRTLSRNHRSPVPIAAIVGAFQAGHPISDDPSGSVLSVGAVANPSAEASAVAARVVDLRKQGVPFRSQVVLTWANSDLDTLADVLRKHEVPILHLGNLLQRKEIQGVLSFLRMVLDPSDEHLIAAASLLHPAVAPDETREILREATCYGEAVATFLKRERCPSSVDEASRLRILCLIGQCEAAKRGPFTARLVDWLHEPGGVLTPLLSDTRPAEVRMALVALHHLLNICRDHEVMGGTIQDLESRIKHARSLEQRTRFHEVSVEMPDVDAVRLLTIRSSRGREFDVVHAVGLHAKTRKVRSVTTDADERANVTVALSRARERLHVSWSAALGRSGARPLIQTA